MGTFSYRTVGDYWIKCLRDTWEARHWGRTLVIAELRNGAKLLILRVIFFVLFESSQIRVDNSAGETANEKNVSLKIILHCDKLKVISFYSICSWLPQIYKSIMCFIQSICLSVKRKIIYITYLNSIFQNEIMSMKHTASSNCTYNTIYLFASEEYI